MKRIEMQQVLATTPGKAKVEDGLHQVSFISVDWGEEGDQLRYYVVIRDGGDPITIEGDTAKRLIDEAFSIPCLYGQVSSTMAETNGMKVRSHTLSVEIPVDEAVMALLELERKPGTNEEWERFLRSMGCGYDNTATG
jgi:hypothetical protein